MFWCLRYQKANVAKEGGSNKAGHNFLSIFSSGWIFFSGEYSLILYTQGYRAYMPKNIKTKKQSGHCSFIPTCMHRTTCLSTGFVFQHRVSLQTLRLFGAWLTYVNKWISKVNTISALDFVNVVQSNELEQSLIFSNILLLNYYTSCTGY